MSNFANRLRERWLAGNQRRIDLALKMAWTELNAARAEEKLKRDYMFGIVQAERKAKDKQASSRVSVSGKGNRLKDWHKTKKEYHRDMSAKDEIERKAIKGWQEQNTKIRLQARKDAEKQLEIKNQGQMQQFVTQAGDKKLWSKRSSIIAKKLREQSEGYIGNTIKAGYVNQMAGTPNELKSAKSESYGAMLHQMLTDELQNNGYKGPPHAGRKAQEIITLVIPQVDLKVDESGNIIRNVDKKESSINEYVKSYTKQHGVAKPRRKTILTEDEWKNYQAGPVPRGAEQHRFKKYITPEGDVRYVDHGTILSSDEVGHYMDAQREVRIMEKHRPSPTAGTGFSGRRGAGKGKGTTKAPEFYTVAPVRAEAAYARAYELMNMGAKPPKKGLIKRLMSLDFKPTPTTVPEIIERPDALTVAQRELARDQLIGKMRNLPPYAQESIKIWPEASRIAYGHDGVIEDRNFEGYDRQAVNFSKALVKNFQDKKDNIDVIMQKLATNKFADSEEDNQRLKKQASTYFWAQTLVDQRGAGNQDFINSLEKAPDKQETMVGTGLVPFYQPVVAED